ncbi:MAG: efflux RND transporter periplasmic adaptor subunit [Lachnospiraceae bacterium]|nr:efflux RND transporter periplasmic adaptor subunit [Lachnospiraceae bacterium]
MEKEELETSELETTSEEETFSDTELTETAEVGEIPETESDVAVAEETDAPAGDETETMPEPEAEETKASGMAMKEIKKAKKQKEKKKKNFLPLIIVAVVLIVLIGIGIAITMAAKKALSTMTENKTEVKAFGMQDISTYINTTGTLESQSVEYVSTSLTYPVETITVVVGDEVQAGELLCVLDTSELEKQIATLEKQASAEDRQQAKQLESSRHQLDAATHSANGQVVDAARELQKAKKAYDTAVSQLAEAQHISDVAKGNYDALAKEYADSVSANTLPADSLTELKNKMDLAKAAYEATLEPLAKYTTARDAAGESYEAVTDNYNKIIIAANDSLISAKDSQEMTYISGLGVSQTAQTLAKYYEQRESAQITAGQSGIVTAIYAKEGAAATGNLMQIEDATHFKLNVDIKERDIFKIAEGQTVDISNDSLKEVTGQGTVTKVLDFIAASGASSSQSLAGAQMTGTTSASYRATITIDSGENLLLGMKVKAKIHVGSNESLMAVPYTAVMGSEGEEKVFVAKELGNDLYQVTAVSVETGQGSDYYTEIIGGDLAEGDLVVLYPEMVMEGGVISVDDGSAPVTDKDDKDDKDKKKEEKKDDSNDGEGE